MPLNLSIGTLKLSGAAAAASLLLALLGSAQAAAQGLPPLPGQQMAAGEGRGQAQARYDFAYQSSDPRVLVFDDGRDTRIQLPAGVIMPTIVGIQTQGEVLVAPEVQSPYILARGVFQRVVLRWGNGQQIQVQYLGRTALPERNGPAVAYGAITPSESYGAQAAPMLVSVAARSQAQVVPVAYTQPNTVPNPPQFTQPLTAQATARGPATGELTRETTTFEFRPSDRTMSGTLRRWASAQGYELVWDLPAELDPRITRSAVLPSMTFTQALELVIKGMKAKGYAVGAHVYTDGVIHFRVEVSESNA